MLEVRYDVVVLEVTRGAPSNARADLLSRAASRRRPARAGASSVVEGRGAHPRQTDRQLVGGGQIEAWMQPEH